MQVSPVTLLTNVTIPAEQGQYVKATTQYSNEPESMSTNALFEPSDKFISRSRLLILPALTKINTDSTIILHLMCKNGNTCVKGPCMLESLRMTMSCKSVFFWDTE